MQTQGIAWFSIRIALLVVPLLAGGVGAAEIESLDGHHRGILQMRVSPDGKTLATVAGDGQILLRSTDQLATPHVLKREADETRNESGYQTFCFTRDSRFLLATGGIENLQALSDQIEKFDLQENSRVVSSYSLLGSVHHLNLIGEETEIAYLSAGKLLNWNVEQNRFARKVALQSPYTSVCVSPKSSLYAFHEHAERKSMEGKFTLRTPTDPCRIVIREPSGKVVLEALLPASSEFSNTLLHFVSDDRLLACRDSGEIRQWVRTEDDPHWKPDESKTTALAIDPTSPPATAVCMGETDDICWLARGEHLIAVDLRTGKSIANHKLEVGEPADQLYHAGPISALVALRPQQRLVAGLWNGKLAVVPLTP